MMKDDFSLPEWYPLDEYTHELTPELALKMVYKRITLKKILSSELHDQTKIENHFEKIIIKSEVPDILQALYSNLPKAIQPLSVTEAYMIVAMLVNNQEFRNRPDIAAFEDAVMKASRGEHLSDEQKAVLQYYRETPWYNFQPDKDNTWIPNLPCSNGAPTTINPAISRNDALHELKRFYNIHHKSKTRNISDATIHEWREKKIFEIHDLLLWSDIRQDKIRKLDLFNALWDTNPPPSKKIIDSTVDMKTFIKVTMKLLNGAICESTLKTLFFECSKRKALHIT